MKKNAKLKKNRKPLEEARSSYVRVKMNKAEKEQITANADAAGMYVAGFMRAASLGLSVTAKLDKLIIREIIKSGAEMGRIGGLLKLLLGRSKEAGVNLLEARVILGQLEEAVAEIKKLIRQATEATRI